MLGFAPLSSAALSTSPLYVAPPAVIVDLAASCIETASDSASMICMARDLAASSTAATSITATIYRLKPLQASCTTTTSATASIIRDRPNGAAVADDSSITIPEFDKFRALQAATSSAIDIQATLFSLKPLAASLSAGISISSPSLIKAAGLSASLTDAVAITALLGQPRQLSFAVSDATTLVADLRKNRGYGASLEILVDARGELTIHRPVVVAVVARTTITAGLTKVAAFTATCADHASTTAALHVKRPFHPVARGTHGIWTARNKAASIWSPKTQRSTSWNKVN